MIKSIDEEDSKKALELKKHVAVIHSNNNLTLLQRKIANALLFNAYDELLEKDEHEIHIATLCRMIGYDSHDHKTIKKSLVNLLSTVLEWNLVDRERLDLNGVWNASSIIADASIDGSICTYSYSNKMRKLLHRPNLYGRVDMVVQAKFQSSYGLALYENCNRFQDIGKTPWFDIITFRQLMGVDDNKYQVFRDFKTRVLDKAVDEVNKYSSICVDPQLRKEKRKVISVQFLIKNSPEQQSIIHSANEGNLTTILKTQFGFSKQQIHRTLESYGIDYINEKIKLIQNSPSFKSGKIHHLAKYLLSALKDDYQSTKKSPVTSTSTNLYTEQEKKRQEQIKREAYRRYQDKQLIQAYQQLSPAIKKKLLVEFEFFLGRGMYKDIYMRQGMENILIQDQLCFFIRQKHGALLSRIPSYEQWLTEDITA